MTSLKQLRGAYFHLGVYTSCTADLYFDDFACDSIINTDDLGDIRTLAARPAGEGTDDDNYTTDPQGWADSTGAADAVYTELTDDPPNTALYNRSTGDALTHRYSVTMDQCGSGNLAGIGGSDTIEAVNFMWLYQTNGGGTDDYGIRIRCSDDGGSPYTNDNIDDPKTATWIAHYDAATPVGANAWTQAYVNSLEMGMATVSSGGKYLGFDEAYAMVAFKVAGVSALSVNVFDSIGVAEDVAAVRLPREIEVADNVGITDNVSVEIPVLEVNVYDSIGVADAVDVKFSFLQILVYELIAVASAVAALIPFAGPVSVFDSVAVADSVSVEIPVLEVSVYDSIGVADETYDELAVLDVSVYDDIGLSDTVGLALDVYEISVVDLVGVSDEVDASVTGALTVSVYDDIGVAEDVSVEIPVLEVNVFDSIGVAEDAICQCNPLLGNDFSGDTSCIALWNFEPSALTVDSKGANTLTNNIEVAENTLDYKQGTGCGEWEASEGDSLTIDDDDVDSGFPCKYGESNRSFSICGWFKVNSLAYTHYLCFFASAYEENKAFAIVVATNGYLALFVSSDGSSFNSHAVSPALSTDIWYFVGITYEDVTGKYKISIYNESTLLKASTGTSSVKSIFIGTPKTFHIGYPDYNITWDGLVDEFVVFNRVLSVEEIDAIWNRQFPVLNVNVADNIGVAENVSVEIPAAGALSVNVSDNIGVLDEVEALVPILEVSVSDTIGLADEAAAELDLYEIAVSDDIGVNDEAGLSIPVLLVSVFDSIGLGDDVGLEIPVLEVSVFDSVGLADETASQIPILEILAADNVGLSDAVEVSIPVLEVSVADTIGLTDAVDTFYPLLEIAVGDIIGLTDGATAIRQDAAVLNVYVFDDIQVSDEADIQIAVYEVCVFDAVGVADETAIQLPVLEVLASDSVGVTDVTGLEVPVLEIFVSDSLGLTDAAGVTLVEAGVLSVNVYDTISLSDSVEQQFTFYEISVYDTLTVIDEQAVLLTVLNVAVSDSLVLTDSVVIVRPGAAFTVDVYDIIGLADAAACVRLPDWQHPTEDSLAEWAPVTDPSAAEWTPSEDGSAAEWKPVADASDCEWSKTGEVSSAFWSKV